MDKCKIVVDSLTIELGDLFKGFWVVNSLTIELGDFQIKCSKT